MPDYSPTLETKKFGTLNYGDLRPRFINFYQNYHNLSGESFSNKTRLNEAIKSTGGKTAYTQFAGPDGKDYFFIPEDFLTKGYASNGKVWTPKGILDPKHLDPFLKQAEYVDFSNLGAESGKEDSSIGASYNDFFKSVGQTPKGFLIPVDAKNGDGYDFSNQLRISDPIPVREKLVQQIMGQGTSSKWSGEGAGSPTANAGMMADVLMSAGINDIRDFGRIKQQVGTALSVVELKDPNDPSKGGYYNEIDGEGNVTGNRVEATPEQMATFKRVQIGYTPEDSYIQNQITVPMYRETFGNKLTTQPINANYDTVGGNIFSGTYGGHGKTNFGVQFAPDGTPVFYTQFGGDTSTLSELRQFLPIAGFALNFVFPGAGAALGTALGATGATAAIVGNAIINGAMAEAAGGDFWKAAAGSAIGGAMAGASGSLPSTGSVIVDKAISGGVTAAITGGDPLQGALNGAITAGINEFVPTTGNKIADSAIASGINAALTGRDVEDAIVSGAITGVGKTIRDERIKGGAATGSGTSVGSDTTDIAAPTGGAGFDGIDTKTVTDEDGTQFVYDQDNNLIDIIQGTTTPATPEVETGVSMDTSGAINVPAVTQPSTDAEAGVSTDTSGAGVVTPPVTQPPPEETGVSTDTSGAETVAPPAIQPPTEETGVSTDTSGAETVEPPVKQPETSTDTETGVSTDTSGAEPGAQETQDTTCAPGFHFDEGRGICVPDDDDKSEPADTGLTDPVDDSPSCAEGYTWDEARQICVANDDPVKETQECPEGYIYDLGARACVKATSVATGSGGGGGRPSGGTSNAGGSTGGGSLIPTLAAAAGQPISRAIVDEPMRRIGLPIYEKMSEFEGPLSDFLEMVQKGSYISKPNQPEQPMQPNMNQQTQPDRLDQPAAPGGYFNYGQESSIDSILNPGNPLQGFARGGMATPLMAAGGTTRYGMNSGGALDVIHHSGKPRLDFRKGAAVTGEGDGQSDDIPAMLADGEFVFPADVVAALGNGSTKAGSDKLYEMMHSIREYHRSAKPEDLPPPAKKSPLDYLKKPAKKARK